MGETTIDISPKNLDEALLAFQADMPILVRDRDGQAGNQKTKYADLAQANRVVLARLNQLGVTYKAKPTLRPDDPKFVLHYELTHVASGTKDEGDYPLKLAENPQHMGSAISYARRYVLLSLTGVAAEDEDDDGEAAAGRHVAQRAPQRQRPAEPASEAGAAIQRRAQRRAQTVRPPLPGEDADGKVGQDQHRHMHALWRDLGYDGEANRDTRLGIMTKILRLESLDSSADLTRGQADTVIAALRERKERMAQPGGGAPS